MTDCSHVEWGVRLANGQVQPAASRPEAEFLAGYEQARRPDAAECVVMVREVRVAPWSPAAGPTATS